MDEEKFNITFILIQPYVQKKDTVMREDIFAEERLITALSYLAIVFFLDLVLSAAISLVN